MNRNVIHSRLGWTSTILVLVVAAGTLARSRRPPEPRAPAARANVAAPAIDLRPTAAPVDAALDHVRRVVAEAAHPRAKELLAQLEQEREAYDEVARAYDDLHRRYQ